MSPLLLVINSIIACVFVNAADPTIVNTEYGPIKGLIIGDGARTFRGIPYAKPPIGQLRWADPEPPQSWSSTLDCTTEVVGCPQTCHQLPLDATECPSVQSEDCLYVNVWAPIDSTPDSNLQVLLFIHGGSFWTGYGGGLVYNGTQFVNVTNTVVVTINYRLGALGSLYDESLGLYGNYGYKDQVFAIEWAYRNIKNFGGNPERIVIFGESAGAHSVALHLMNKTSLIAGGIMESPPIGLPLRTKESWGTLPLTLSKQLGCDPDKLSPSQRLTCLRAVNASIVVANQKSANQNDPQTGYAMIKGGMPYTPTVGNDYIIDQPVLAFQKGEYNTKIPWMAGTNSGESFLFTPPVVTYHDLVNGVETDFPKEDVQRILNFYNITEADRGENMYETYGQALTDYMFRCPTRNALESSLIHADKPENIGYFYHFNYIASYAQHVWYYQPLCWTHVCHTEELPAVFDPNSTTIDVYPTQAEVLQSQQIQYYWSNFAQTGNPSQGNGANKLNTKWTNYGSNTLANTLMINTVGTNGIVMNSNPDKRTCDFWDSLGYNWFNGTGN